MEDSYYSKYLKYKNKYLSLKKNNFGGSSTRGPNDPKPKKPGQVIKGKDGFFYENPKLYDKTAEPIKASTVSYLKQIAGPSAVGYIKNTSDPDAEPEKLVMKCKYDTNEPTIPSTTPPTLVPYFIKAYPAGDAKNNYLESYTGTAKNAAKAEVKTAEDAAAYVEEKIIADHTKSGFLAKDGKETGDESKRLFSDEAKATIKDIVSATFDGKFNRKNERAIKDAKEYNELYSCFDPNNPDLKP